MPNIAVRIIPDGAKSVAVPRDRFTVSREEVIVLWTLLVVFLIFLVAGWGWRAARGRR